MPLSDPFRRISTTRTIASTNMLLAIASLCYHIWSFVWTLIEPERITKTGQTEVVVYMGMVIMTLISLILLPVSWNLFKRVGTMRSNPNDSIRACLTWRRWCGCFLTFFITALMILVLSSEKNVHQGIIQNYMACLLIVITFTIYGIYYVGKLLTELRSCDRLGMHTELNNSSCHENSGHQIPDPGPEISFITLT